MAIRAANKLYVLQVLVVGISTTLLACASPVDTYESAGDPVAVRGNDCIFQSSIRDYQILDDKNLIVSAGNRDKYHLELARKAFGLRSSWTVGFLSQTGRICPGFGEVIVDDGFGRKETIRVSSIRKLGQDEVDTLLVQYGKKDPATDQTAEPQEVEGAAVEELD